MKIQWSKIKTDFKGETCFTHARGVILENGFGVITTQPLRLSGSDIFYGMYISTTQDGGETWSELKPSKTITRKDIGDGVQVAMCDATPMYHKKTGKIILIGHYAAYINDEMMPDPRPRHATYAVYDEDKGDFSSIELIEMPKDEKESYFSFGNGSGQSLELDNGELLIPIDYYDKESAITPWSSCMGVSVIRCTFDGKTIKVVEIGNSLSVSVPRGLCEPSIVCYNGEYFLALRNDETGFIAKGKDGLHFEEPKELMFDDGKNVGNYCTQQHWIKGGGKLYMVYTRKGADNDHVFRHRAPLFIAKFDTEKMCIIRETEKVVVPNRGARLGNFGCQSFDDGKKAIVYASEWMQTTDPDPFDYTKCMKYGSDNSIFVSHIEF